MLKGIVVDKETKKREFVTLDCRTKREFINAFRENGYSVNPIYVKPEDVFDAIVDYTDNSDWAFKACKTIEDAKNWHKTFDKYLDKMLAKTII